VYTLSLSYKLTVFIFTVPSLSQSLTHSLTHTLSFSLSPQSSSNHLTRGRFQHPDDLIEHPSGLVLWTWLSAFIGPSPDLNEKADFKAYTQQFFVSRADTFYVPTGGFEFRF
jgi:hypothetical protein